MKTLRQVVAAPPWIATFNTSIEAKFKELDRALSLPPSQETSFVGLTREAVEGIAFAASTSTEIAVNFLNVLRTADQLLASGISPYRILYILTGEGLTISLTEKMNPVYE